MAAANDPFWYPKDYVAESERRRARLANVDAALQPVKQPRYMPSNEALIEVAKAQAERRLKEAAAAHAAQRTSAGAPTMPNPRPAANSISSADKVDAFLTQATLRNQASSNRITSGFSSLSDSDRRPRRIILEQGNISISIQDVRAPVPKLAPPPPPPPAPKLAPAAVIVSAPPSVPKAAPAPVLLPAPSHPRRSSGSSIHTPRLEAVPENAATETNRSSRRASFDSKSSPLTAAVPLAASAPIRTSPILGRQGLDAPLPPVYLSQRTTAPTSPPTSAGSVPYSADSSNSRQSEREREQEILNTLASPLTPASSSSNLSVHSRHSDASASSSNRDRDPSTPPKPTAHASKTVRVRTLSESVIRAPPNTPVKPKNPTAPPAPVGILKRPTAHVVPLASISPSSDALRHILPAVAQPTASAPAQTTSVPRNAFGETVQIPLLPIKVPVVSAVAVPPPATAAGPPAPGPFLAPAPVRHGRPSVPLNPATVFAALGPENAARLVRKTRFANMPEEDIVVFRPPQMPESPRRSSFESGTDAAAQREEFRHTHRRGASAAAAGVDGAPPPGLPTIRRQPGATSTTRPAQRVPQHAVAAALRHRAKKTLSVASLEVWTGETTEGDTSGLESARSSVYQTWGTVPETVDVDQVIARWIEQDAAKARANRGRRNRPGVTFDFPEEEMPSSTGLTEAGVSRLSDAVRNHNER